VLFVEQRAARENGGGSEFRRLEKAAGAAPEGGTPVLRRIPAPLHIPLKEKAKRTLENLRPRREKASKHWRKRPPSYISG